MAVNYDELIARLGTDGEADPFATILAEAEAQDPRMKLVRALVERRRRRAVEADAEGTPPAQMSVTDPARLGQVVTDACAELAHLRVRGQRLASALGACPACWGEDERCRTCRGEGRPGAVQPDVALFRELIAPAVARLARSPDPDPLRARGPDRSTARSRQWPDEDEDGHKERSEV